MDQLFSAEFWQETNHRILQWLIKAVPSLFLVFLMLFVSLWVFGRLAGRLQKTMMRAAKYSHSEESIDEKEKRVNTLVNIIRQTGQIVIWAVFILIMLREIDIDIAPILASAGIIGLAIGFGAQEFVRDFISGFFILIENQIREGDVAVINGTAGLVEQIALRTITLRDFTGTVHIFQSGKINTLSNLTKEWSAAVFEIGVAYKEDIEKVKRVIREVGDELMQDAEFQEFILEPIEVLGLDKLDDSALIFKARFKTKPGQQWMITRAFNERMKKRFDLEGIEIPFPHRTITWSDPSSPLPIAGSN